jgi:hypothetical protein
VSGKGQDEIEEGDEMSRSKKSYGAEKKKRMKQQTLAWPSNQSYECQEIAAYRWIGKRRMDPSGV